MIQWFEGLKILNVQPFRKILQNTKTKDSTERLEECENLLLLLSSQDRKLPPRILEKKFPKFWPLGQRL